MTFIQEIFEAMGSILTQFVAFIVDVFEGVISIFYTSGEQGGITEMGYILFLGVVVGLFWFVLSWLRRLITLRNRG